MSEPLVKAVFSGPMLSIEEIEELTERVLDAHEGSVFNAPQLGQCTVYLSAPVDQPLKALAHLEPTLHYLVDEFTKTGRVLVAVESMISSEAERREADNGLPALVCAKEAAEILGTSRQNVHQRATSPDFPQPLYHLASGKLWSEKAIRAFAERPQ
ncbi:helix-turn-helix transcriptional regulator [Kitasatospora sp. NPDC006697]|uniref:helix-turn-helix transcriptional regulator n=1 Tax=Kitasatospora sp. NPDC006697 TaxID=3364020 RepID=UPI0036BB2A12